MSWCRPLILLRHDGIVDILLLRRVDAHQRLDRFEDTLGIANQVTVDLLRRQVLDQAGEEAREVKYLAVGPAHGRETVPIREDLRKSRIDAALVFAFVLDDLRLDYGICFNNQR